MCCCPQQAKPLDTLIFERLSSSILVLVLKYILKVLVVNSKGEVWLSNIEAESGRTGLAIEHEGLVGLSYTDKKLAIRI